MPVAATNGLVSLLCKARERSEARGKDEVASVEEESSGGT